jgi:hypothetical protein
VPVMARVGVTVEVTVVVTVGVGPSRPSAVTPVPTLHNTNRTRTAGAHAGSSQ